MHNKIATAAMIIMTIIGISTASVDVVCLLLWHHDDDVASHNDNSLSGHHPDASESHLHGTDSGEPLAVSMLTFVVDDGLLKDALLIDGLQRGQRLHYTPSDLMPDPLFQLLEQPPQSLS